MDVEKNTVKDSPLSSKHGEILKVSIKYRKLGVLVLSFS
jgi:hypothetical protein